MGLVPKCLLLLSLFLAAGVLAGCGDGGATSSGDGDKKPVVGFSQIGAESAWRIANTDSIKSEAAKRGIVAKNAASRKISRLSARIAALAKA